MEKLSHILPTNNRISNVDLKGGAPVRPGAPSFGRPMGLNSKIRQERIDTAKAAQAAEKAAKNVQMAPQDKIQISSKAQALQSVNQPVELKVSASAKGPIQMGALNKASVSLSSAPTGPAVETQSTVPAIDVVEDQVQAKVQSDQKVKVESKIAEYPQATRNILNQTSVANQLVNELAGVSTEIAQREDEEI